jgi:hypothetical protein
MDLATEILKADFKERVEYVANIISGDKENFTILINLFLSEDCHTCQRASWVLGHCIDLDPKQIIPWLDLLVKNLFTEKEDAVKRNTIRALQFVGIPEKLWGETVEICFRFLMGNEAIAIKVFSMTVLYNLSIKIPEISNELRVVIEDQLPYGSAGFKSRGKKILKMLDTRF